MDLKRCSYRKVFCLEESPDLNGKTYKNGQYPIVDLNFELIYPEHLVFKTKITTT
jgi:hypothetical protein